MTSSHRPPHTHSMYIVALRPGGPRGKSAVFIYSLGLREELPLQKTVGLM